MSYKIETGETPMEWAASMAASNASAAADQVGGEYPSASEAFIAHLENVRDTAEEYGFKPGSPEHESAVYEYVRLASCNGLMGREQLDIKYDAVEALAIYFYNRDRLSLFEDVYGTSHADSYRDEKLSLISRRGFEGLWSELGKANRMKLIRAAMKYADEVA